MVSKNEHRPEQQGQKEEKILSDLLSLAEIIKSNRFMSLESQTKLNIYVGLLLRLLGNDVELESIPERLISLTPDAGTEFITF